MNDKQFKLKCPKCNNDIIKVSCIHNMNIYSCYNESCEIEAELLINLGTDIEPFIVGLFDMIRHTEQILSDMKESK